ncbi:60S ribosome subunit biogenesis protein NIP7 homolog isoform X1 [Desmodus rotundus]|uniref:60S ribosome subunit biogenesis protein NIP7 homolog isoform X1 n=1 Tax=Desmodus rotundus TaxID=9430 RepID=UPI0023817612|nr:60S ribosome subunit biogenesis protein NIP7 homolog isoform X1 [Desmodus rotundus]
MRPLTEEETRVMFEKIAKYIGENLQLLVDRPDGTYCFRLHNDRVYYVSEKILKLAANISGDKLVSLGTCFGKFTKTHKFRLHVTALDYLAPYAKYKVWIKPGAEQSFLYGNHVLKSGLGRITENTAQYQGVVVYSMADVPLREKEEERETLMRERNINWLLSCMYVPGPGTAGAQTGIKPQPTYMP